MEINLLKKIFQTYWSSRWYKRNNARGLIKKNKPDEILKLAVKRMLPGGPLAKNKLTKLKIYPGENHPHKAQNPKVIDLKILNNKNLVR